MSLPKNSIFSRRWWAVALCVPRSKKHVLPSSLSSIADELGLKFSTKESKNRRCMMLLAEGVDALDGREGTRIYSVFVQEERTFVPISLGRLEIEASLREAGKTDEMRDYPMLMGFADSRPILRFPLFIGESELPGTGPIVIVCGPYLLHVADFLAGLLKALRLRTNAVTVRIQESFDVLRAGEADTTLGPNVTARVGSMEVSGFPDLDKAVFFGSNVVRSELYSYLTSEAPKLFPNMKVSPRMCTMRRTFPESGMCVDRRPFFCSFDEFGNYRFAPGGSLGYNIAKLSELLGVFERAGLLEIRSNNPTEFIGG